MACRQGCGFLPILLVAFLTPLPTSFAFLPPFSTPFSTPFAFLPPFLPLPTPLRRLLRRSLVFPDTLRI